MLVLLFVAACSMVVRTVIGIIVFLGFWSYRLYSKMFVKDDTIEEFLHSYKNLVPRRYSYLDIKKMTIDFKDKLGQGGFLFSKESCQMVEWFQR